MDGNYGRPGAIVHSHFRQDVLHVVLNRLFTDAKRCTDLFVAEAIGDQGQHLDFAPSELGLRQAVGELPGDFGRDRASPCVDVADCLHEVLSPVRNDRNSADSVDEPLAGMRYALYNSF
jgi:hypothetical protein